MKKSIIYGLIVVVVAASAYFMLRPDSSSSKADIFAQVKKSNFVVAVNATGELKAKKSIKIRGPQGM